MIYKQGIQKQVYTDNWILHSIVFIYLFLNLSVRVWVIYSNSSLIGKGILIGIALYSLWCLFFPRHLDKHLFVFGFSFFLFGFTPNNIYGQTFEFIVSTLTLVIFLLNVTKGANTLPNMQLTALFLCFICLCLLSFLLLPLGYIYTDLLIFTIKDFLYNCLFGNFQTYFFSLAGINRLLIFTLFAYQLSKRTQCRQQYAYLFSGIFIGAVFSAFIGIGDTFTIISLDFYRERTHPGALQTTFENTTTYGQFMVTVVPYVLFGFMNKRNSIYLKIVLICVLIVCEIAMLLSHARASWVTYPILLFFCWLFIYLFKENSFDLAGLFNVRGILRIIVSIPITITISVVLIFMILIPLSERLQQFRATRVNSELKEDGRAKALSQQQLKTPSIDNQSPQPGKLLRARAAMLLSDGIRMKLWKEGFIIGMENPMFGMGYDTYAFHVKYLRRIKDSSLNLELPSLGVFETPHNLYVHHFVNGGIAALLLWFAVILYMLMLLLLDIVKNKTYFNAPVIISIVGFNIYGIFESMQFNSMIWFLFFINLSYTITIDSQVLSIRQTRLWRLIIVFFVILTILGGVNYYRNSSFRLLKVKYKIDTYGIDEYSQDNQGLYLLKDWPEGHENGTAIITKTGTIELAFQYNRNVKARSLAYVKVLLDNELIDTINFHINERIRKRYYISASTHQVRKLRVISNRAGILISELKFIDISPGDYIGFYQVERWDMKDVPQWHEMRIVDVRWIATQASIMLDERMQKGLTLFLKVSHLDINKNPVSVRILDDQGIAIASLVFTDDGVKKLVLPATEISMSKVLTFNVNRTWNPCIDSDSMDCRDLGLAVIVLPTLLHK